MKTPGKILYYASMVFCALLLCALVDRCEKRYGMDWKSQKKRQEEQVAKQALICQKVYPQLTFDECKFVLSR